MPAIRLVTVSGPRGAGKETVLNALRHELGLYRIVPHTTREPRPTELHGREYHFVHMAEFERMLAAGEFIYSGRIGESQRSGTHRNQFTVSENGSIIDITPSGARHMREIVSNELGGFVLMLGVFADVRERRVRIAKRDPGITVDKVEQLLREDPVSNDKRDYADFGLLIDNGAEDPAPACARAVAVARNFLFRTV